MLERQIFEPQNRRPKITICVGSSCFARGNGKNVEFAEKYLAARGLKDAIDFDMDGCLCMNDCAVGPVVTVDGKVYTHVDEGLMRDILDGLFPEKAKGV